MTSPGSENAIIDQIIVSVSPTSSPANIRLHKLQINFFFSNYDFRQVVIWQTYFDFFAHSRSAALGQQQSRTAMSFLNRTTVWHFHDIKQSVENTAANLDYSL
jgi:hypothetical protein